MSPLGGTGFNQVLIQVQLMYNEEKHTHTHKKHTLPVFYRVLPSGSVRASRVTNFPTSLGTSLNRGSTSRLHCIPLFGQLRAVPGRRS